MDCKYCGETATHGVGYDSLPVCEKHYKNRPVMDILTHNEVEKLIRKQHGEELAQMGHRGVYPTLNGCLSAYYEQKIKKLKWKLNDS